MKFQFQSGTILKLPHKREEGLCDKNIVLKIYFRAFSELFLFEKVKTNLCDVI